MRYLLSVLFVPGVLLAGPEPNETEKLLKKLEGTWTVTSWEKDGKPAPDKAFKDMRMIFAKDTLTIKQGKKTLGMGTFKINAGQKPHAIDYKESKDITSVYDVGIFEIEGDTMKYCTTADAKKRPTKFDSKLGWLFVLKKDKK
jgi:uncharacterized protein (TIGR03067 family)